MMKQEFTLSKAMILDLFHSDETFEFDMPGENK